MKLYAPKAIGHVAGIGAAAPLAPPRRVARHRHRVSRPRTALDTVGTFVYVVTLCSAGTAVFTPGLWWLLVVLGALSVAFWIVELVRDENYRIER